MGPDPPCILCPTCTTRSTRTLMSNTQKIGSNAITCGRWDLNPHTSLQASSSQHILFTNGQALAQLPPTSHPGQVVQLHICHSLHIISKNPELQSSHEAAALKSNRFVNRMGMEQQSYAAHQCTIRTKEPHAIPEICSQPDILVHSCLPGDTDEVWARIKTQSKKCSGGLGVHPLTLEPTQSRPCLPRPIHMTAHSIPYGQKQTD